MDCPICHVKLQMSDRQGIEIDYCPQCRGIWLDRGELDKIIERSQTDFSTYGQRNEYREEYKPHDQYGGYDYRYKKHKKKSFLEDIFDFD
ncbi:MAG: zf-TFIIB domain-containing protein [Clostridia bacterium]|nr:zf-TFIIB domain-containing protein [Clostridia bacterium]